VNDPQAHSPMPQATIVELLTTEGVKPTAQRVRVAEILLGSPRHMSADQILDSLRLRGERISKATVYNTLKVLADCGLVRQINVDPECAVYDSTCTPHHHFHDLETGELLDIPSEEIAFSRFPSLPPGMEAEAVEVVIRIRRRPSAS
jgi:Fur family transcriptional regulator, iron response regulator